MTEQERKDILTKAEAAYHGASAYGKPVAVADRLEAALIAAGVIPPAKVPTEGERIAERMVPSDDRPADPNAIYVRHPTEESKVIGFFQGRGFSGTSIMLREYIAAAIDHALDARPALPAVDVEALVDEGVRKWYRDDTAVSEVFRHLIRRARGEE